MGLQILSLMSTAPLNCSKLYKPSILKSFLNTIEAAPNKRLSQNFLIDGNVLQKLIDCAQITPNDTVLEIGPGPGVITEALLKTGAQVIAVEKDRKFANALPRLTSENLTVYWEDFLKFEMQNLPKRFKVISNLPFHLTTPILTKLLPLHSKVESLTLIAQEEFAKRAIAAPGSKDFSSLTLFLEYYAHASVSFFIPATCFYPKPKVNSALIQLIPKNPPTELNADHFFSVTRTAFGQRRKTLKRSLQKLFSAEQVSHALHEMKLTLDIRPEQLSFENFKELTQILFSF